ncbi:MAG: phosphotransferase, partial [Nitrospirota bacterium]|nr:phosphotransferase [Nitrospirota bacterium]
LVLDEKGFLENVGAGLKPASAKAFTGIAVYEPGFLDFLPAGASSVVDAWLKAVSSGERIGAFDVSGCYWNDIGTPSAYVSAVFHKLRAEGENVFVHGSVTKCSGADIEGNVVIEAGCELRPGVSLKNCIVLPGCAVGVNHGSGRYEDDGSTFFENCIIGPGFRIDLDEKDILNIDAQGKQLIGVGGSDRNYFRTRDRYRSSVLMQCKGDDPDFDRHIEYAHFFMRHGVPVPGLISVEAGSKSAVFEDAGDMLLYSWLKCPGGVEDIEDIYRKVMDIMAMFHSTATEHVYECPPLQERVFDLKYFRWETEYFCERFVEGSRGVRYKDKPALDNELDALAAKAFSFPKTVMHRDFQSQNIMVMKGRRLRVIDYQGARIGPPGYDAASMLWDPYYRIEDRMRDRLIGHYISLMRERTGNGFETLRFMESLTVCRLQRHMQALGAYGFLSSVKGKKYFLKHIPGALRLLKEDISLCADEYPVLHELIMGL